ncbi:ferritin [uncultured Dialister sp.]|jgi:ferritin|uniref:ferritin n=1 Tax=uncultured Dialister sp. TaxID=278064 RepID=UPI0025D48007|nr:ferritin [uncultured Dialister sp.]
MKLSKKLLKALNAQINLELASAYLYRAMSHDMKNLALHGYAKWLDKQYEEERQHAFKIISYVEDRDGVVDFDAVAGVGKHYGSPLDAAKDSLAHEEKVSASIRDLFRLAREEGDIETELFLQWFVTEQVEEEVNARDNVAGFEKAKDCEGLLYMFDAHLGGR